MVDEINVIHVRFVEDKIKVTMCRLNSLKKWKCSLVNWQLKQWMLVKLRHQLDFLLRVQKVKYKDFVNDIGGTTL